MNPRLLHDHQVLMEENARLRRECLRLSRGTHFMTDEERFPHEVVFQNGRRVSLVSVKGRYYLNVGWDAKVLLPRKSQDGRVGNWISTCEGTRLYPFDVRHEDIEIGWIARALANTCRFGGHLKRFLSVAEHCVRASFLVPPEFAPHALLHDGSEGVLQDIVRPLKYESDFYFYRELEDRVQRVVFERFGLQPEMPPEVKRVDDRLVATEARDLQHRMDPEWGRSINAEGKLEKPNPYPFTIRPWSPRLAHRKFLKRFGDLFPREATAPLSLRDRLVGVLDGFRGF